MCGINLLPQEDTTVRDWMQQEAAQARAREEQRQARIRSGLTSIDQTFAPFNDAFYNNRKSAFLDYYRPQLEDQYGEAKDRITYGLARNGTLKSTMAGDQMGKLIKAYGDQWASIVSRAEGDVSGLKQQVNTEKSALTQQLNATADADRVTNDALGRTQQMYQQLPDYSPLGDIFGGFGQAIGNYSNVQNQRAIRDAYFGANGTGSQRIVY